MAARRDSSAAISSSTSSTEAPRAAVVDPLWALPVSPDLVRMAAGYDLVVTLEDNLVEGGVGQKLRARLAEADASARVLTFGVPQQFLTHGSRDEVLEEVGLTAARVAMEVLGTILAQPSAGAVTEPASPRTS